MNNGIATGEMLRDLRLKHGFTQQEISMKMHVNVRTYRRWENNESEVHIDSFIKILSIYGMKLDVIRINDICTKG